MDLSEKYRPKTLGDIKNQDHVVSSIQSVFKRPEKEWPHAFLFCGHHGCGKTTLAYVLKDIVGCSDLNCEYFNASNTRGVDTIRDIDKICRFLPMVKPGEKAIKVYIIDECHELTTIAQNAFLNLLEKPPEHVYFILCTTDPDKLLPTIRSRCSSHVLQSFSRLKLVELIKDICSKENVQFPNDIIRLIADSSENSARNALKILDNVIDIPDDKDVRKAILSASVDHKEVIDICRIMLDKNYTSWPDLCRMLKSIDAKPDEIRRSILNYLGAVAMNSQKYPANLISMCSLFSESITYSGIGALVAQVGLAFKIGE